MSRILNKLPLPVSGLMLGLAALGNVLGGYHPLLKSISGSIAGILFLLITAKCVVYRDALKKGLEHPVVGSVLCTYPMGVMVLSTYLKSFSHMFAMSLWGTAIVLHMVMLILFTKRFLVKLELGKVFPSYFIVYVGFVVASVTAPAFGQQALGQILFWVGLVNLLGLLPIVIKRLVKLGIEMPPAQPTVVIMSAPASLCLAGYMSSFESKSIALILALLGGAMILYIYALSQLPRLLKLPFLPSYSAFTFPLVISAIALKKTSGFILKTTGHFTTLSALAEISVWIAAAVTYYVLFAYLKHLLENDLEPAPSKAKA